MACRSAREGHTGERVKQNKRALARAPNATDQYLLPQQVAGGRAGGVSPASS